MRQRLQDLATSMSVAIARRPNLPGRTEATSLVDLLQEDYGAGALQGPSPQDTLGMLGGVFGLEDLEVDLLTVSVSVDLDARFGVLCGLLLGNHERQRPSVGLALELCGQGSLSPLGRHHLSAAGALRKHKLLTVDGPESALLRELKVPERVSGYVLGDPSPDEIVAPLIVRAAIRKDAVATLMARAFRTGVRLGHVRGSIGTTGLASACGVFEILGVGALVVDLDRRSGAIEAGMLTALATREAGLCGSGLVLTGLDGELARDRAIFQALERSAVPVIVVDDAAWDAGWVTVPVLTLAATELTPEERAETWTGALGHHEPRSEPSRWADLLALKLTPEDIHAAAQAASIEAAAAGEPLSATLLQDAARSQRSANLQSGAVRVIPTATLADLVLPPATQDSVEELVTWARNRESLLADGALVGKGSKGRGLTALFTGLPGTGKTLAAEAVAGELGLELYTIELSAIVDKYIGETEKNLERIIASAENLNVVLFFDEADSLFGSRAAVTDARDRYANQEVSYLLQRIERFQGLALMATNFRGNIDQAFTRRLHHVIDFPEPDESTRERLWATHLTSIDLCEEDDPVDVNWLARHVDLPGGNIRNMVMTAAFLARERQDIDGPGSVTMRHLLTAVARECKKVGRRPPAMPPGRAP